MSYEIAREIRIMDNEVVIESLDNRVYPRTFREWLFMEGKPLEEKLWTLSYCIAQGEIKPMLSSGIAYKIHRKMQELKSNVVSTSIHNDFQYQTDRYDGLERLLAKQVGVPMFMGKRVNSKAVRREIEAYDAESKRIYEATSADYRNKGVVVVDSASWSEIFPEYDVLCSNDECMLGKRENYDNRGHYDNSDASLIRLGKGTGSFFYMLQSGANTVAHYQKSPERYMSAVAMIERGGLDVSRLRVTV